MCSYIDKRPARLYKLLRRLAPHQMPFVAYVHARDPDEPEEEGRAPWEPNWRLWRWVGAAVLVALPATLTNGIVELVLVLVVFGLCFRAALELLPDGDGMRQWRQ